MIHDLSIQFDQEKARKRLEKMIEDKKVIELKEKRKVRSISQNKYLHVLYGLYGIETGYTIDEAKTILKRECAFMVYTEKGNTFLKKTSELSKDEMIYYIEWLMVFCATEGIYLPSATEYLENQFNIDKEIDKNRSFL